MKKIILTHNGKISGGKKSGEWASRQKKKEDKTERAMADSAEEQKRGDSKVESNDSPGNPDRGDTSDIPGLPSG